MILRVVQFNKQGYWIGSDEWEGTVSGHYSEIPREMTLHVILNEETQEGEEE